MALPNQVLPVLTGAPEPIGHSRAPAVQMDPNADSRPDGPRLAAIVHLDMVGYSRLMELDEAGMLARLREVFDGVLAPLAAQGGGRVANTAGDSALLVFPGAAAGVRFALAFQQAVAARGADTGVDRTMRFRIGVTVADVLASDGADVHGTGVNIAARLQAACPPGLVCVSRGVHDQVRDQLDATFEPLGALQLKNIARPVEAYVVRTGRSSRARLRSLVRRLPAARWTALAGLAVLMAGGAGWGTLRHATNPAAIQSAAAALPDLSVRNAPRLSLVVLPFANTSGDPSQDYLADAVTDDLTTDLSRSLDSAFVIGRGSAQTYRGRAVNARQVGGELGVRYLVQGSVRRIGDGMVRVNAELASTELGAVLWTERFDQDVHELGQGQGDIVRRLAGALGAQLVDAEAGRSKRDHPSDPDAFDLVLRAVSLLQHGQTIEKGREVQGLLEQALVLDPSSITAMVMLAYCLMNQNDTLNEGRPENIPRALDLLHAAEKLQPDSPEVAGLRGAMLLWQGRYREGETFYEQALAADPNFELAHHQIAAAKLHTGDPAGALPFYREALRRNPRGGSVWWRYYMIGISLLRMHQPAEAAVWLRRGADVDPARDERAGLWPRAHLASALALSGRIAEARQEVAAIVKLEPLWTARTWEWRLFETSPVGEQLRYVSDGLRLAGLRDHADEDADSGVPSTGELHQIRSGPTPAAVPGAAVIRTDALQRLLAEERPIVLDLNATGRSLPGAIVLGPEFAVGTLDDGLQDRLRRNMETLTGGDVARPIVTLGWNTERWGGRNLALRLVALGYTRVHWYRGGKEVWEGRSLPETEVEPVDW